MDSVTTDFWDVLLWSFWIFIWVAALTVWFRCLFDVFSDHSLSGWAKAGWALLMVLLPWVGTLIYVIARGRHMTERQMTAMARQQAAQEDYIKQVAQTSAGPAKEIGDAKELLDAGAIDQAEFETLKAHALAS